MGCLQKSVWVTPHPLTQERRDLARTKVDVEALLFLEARPAAGETDAEIVAGAWDFAAINQRHADYLQHLSRVPSSGLDQAAARKTFQHWAGQERAAWLEAVSLDPLLPEVLLPPGYLGGQACDAPGAMPQRLGSMVTGGFRR